MDNNKEKHYQEQMSKAIQLIQKLKKEVGESKASPAHILNEPIAIIGMGCRYPGGVKDLESYWELLKNGVNAMTEIPKDRWDIDKYYDENPQTHGKMYVRKGGFIEDVDAFDAAFFEITPREALSYDPSFRLMLEVAYEAIENAGIPFDKIKSQLVSVFMGQSVSDYEQRHLRSSDITKIDAYSITGSFECSGVGRISYLLDLQGANASIETGCSASLVAIHLGCQGLRNGETDLSIVGGVNAITSPNNHIALSQMSGISKDGQCKTFDESADGFARGDGCGIIVLKRLSDAIRDKDNIWAVVRGSAVNHVGRSNGPTAPSTTSQIKLIQQALKNAGLKPEQIDFVEAHGTGTPLGDPIELEAIQATYGKARGSQNPVTVGAVKTNFGHTEGAAGVAGIIKAVLAMQHKQFPPNLHFKKPTPHINWNGTVKISTELTPWDKPEGQTRLAGISSFGIGGTNAHVIVEEVSEEIKQKIKKTTSKTWTQNILPIAAKTPQALKAYAKRYAEFLKQNPNIDWTNVCASVAWHRTHFSQRLAVTAFDKEKAIEQLEAFAESEQESVLALNPEDKQKVVFVFPGQGSQWVGMGKVLYAQSEAFKNAIDECAKAFAPFIDWNLTEELLREEGNRFEEIDVLQPVLIAMEIALAKLWQSIDIQPDAVVGHSMGETAAAYLSGALRLEDVGRIICGRTKLMKKLSGKGAMLLVALTVEQARETIKGYEKQVAIAVSNSLENTVLSGDTDAIQAITAKLENAGIFCKPVKVNVASHSPQMDGLKDDLFKMLAEIKPQPNAVSFYSTVKSQEMDGTTLLPAYWVDNLREPVMFGKVIQQMLEEGYTTFIEMTPHPVLLTPLQEIIKAGEFQAAAIPTLLREREAVQEFTNSICKLYMAGYPVDWQQLYPSAEYIPLPTYPWQKKRYWLEAEYFDGNQVTVLTPLEITQEQEKVQVSFVEQLQNLPKEERLAKLRQHLKERVANVAGIPIGEIGDNVVFKTLGVDSLMYIQLRNVLKKTIGFEISVKEFTLHNTAAKCSTFIEERLSKNIPTQNRGEEVTDHPLYKTRAFLESQSVLDSNFNKEGLKFVNTSWKNVFVTGATGFIGAYLLESILTQTKVKAYCLVRAKNVEEGSKRIKQNLQKYHIWNEDYSKRIVPVLGDLDVKERVGIEAGIWEDLASKIDVIFHMGAHVNWLIAYDDAVQSNVGGTKELLRLAVYKKLKPFHFASTTAVFMSLSTPKRGSLSETYSIDNPDTLYGAYCQTKWVNERILQQAREKGVPINIYRFGDIKGSSKTGIGNPDDFLSSLMKACITLGIEPNLGIELNLVPIDFLADCMLQFALNLQGMGENYHFNTEERIKWADFIQYIRDYGYHIETKPFDGWLKNVREEARFGDENLKKLVPVFSPLKINEQTEKVTYWDIAEHTHALFFDDTNTKKMLDITSLKCPKPLQDGVLEKYLNYFVESGYVEAPNTSPNLNGASKLIHGHDWLEVFNPNPKAKQRLFCFHYAGGSNMMYYPWVEVLSKDIELVTIQLPNRFGESNIKLESIEQIADNVVHALQKMQDKPFAFFGHSMGATVILEVCRKLRAKNMKMPFQLFISANAYKNMFYRAGTYQLSNEDLQKLFPRLSVEVLGDEELVKIIVTTLRSDMKLMDEYEYKPDKPLDIPIVAVGAKNDQMVTPDSLKEWQAESQAGEFQYKLREGMHDYVHDETAFFIDLINKEMAKRKAVPA